MAVVRKWIGVATALVASGWLSTLGPGIVATSSSTPVVGAPAPATGAGTREPRQPQGAEAASVRQAEPRRERPGQDGEGRRTGQGSGGESRREGRPASQASGSTQRQQAERPQTGETDCRVRKCIALTFDDGPMHSTAKLLDILAARGVKATFFVVGKNAAADPATVRREAVAGHEVANHSYTHADLGRSSAAKVESEIGRTQEAVRQATGRAPTLFRPPYGSTDKQVAAVARRHGVAQIIWSVDTNDWRIRNSESVEKRVLRGAHRGAIVLMHDIHPTTVDAVPAILQRLTAKGYTFVTVSDLFDDRDVVPGRKYTGR